ncbi:DUF4352 domain-containing protein [Nocardia iowensis]|uniref:DUF4352 domain-containing protein n=1 Tax=Nocardia iowensis TaxID=204891 RepID=A0ABX8RV58_NOCIO|nr:DUF4352 domain-containing protein [Nocardia iowensis]QXN93534.1 DUF4352 domain-containing protein [Nocardia iowensis]
MAYNLSPYGPDGYQPRRKKPIWPWIVGAVAVVFLLIVGSCGLLISEISSDIEASEKEREAVAVAGSEVRDGKLAFRVTDIDLPVRVLSGNEARGVWRVVRFDVTNISDRPYSFLSTDQYLYDDQERRFAAALSVEGYVELNPGITVSAVLAFDMPEHVRPVFIEFHDSMFSGGARVALH